MEGRLDSENQAVHSCEPGAFHREFLNRHLGQWYPPAGPGQVPFDFGASAQDARMLLPDLRDPTNLPTYLKNEGY